MTLRTGGIRAGTLRRPCTIQEQGVNANGTRGWRDLYTRVYAEVIVLTGAEGEHQLGPINVQSLQLNIRYRPGVRVQQRVILRNRILDITSVVNVDEANVELSLMCREAPTAAPI